MSPCRHRFSSDWAFALLCAALSILLAQSGSAQTVQANQADLARSQTGPPFGTDVTPGGAVEGHAAPSPNDADLGEQQILKRAERYQPFTVSAAYPVYWTSNVALSRTHEQDDWVQAPTAALVYQPRFTPTLFGFASVREQLFYYNQFTPLNFGDFNVAGGLIYLLPQVHNVVLRLDYVYDRLTKKDKFDEFFQNHSILFSAELPLRFGRAQSLSIGGDANISVEADPIPPQRDDFELYIGYNVRLARAFTIDAVGRVVLREYRLTDRLDVSEILAITASCNITRFLTVSAISTLAASRSNHTVFDYDVANLGGVISLSVKF